jgi:hypothetical protein
MRACPDGEPRVDPVTGRSWGWQNALALEMFASDDPIEWWLKCRQVGFTYFNANAVNWCAMTHVECPISVHANVQRGAETIIRRTRMAYRKLPAWLQAFCEMTAPHIARLEWANGSTAEPFSGDPNAGRGDAPAFVFVDEVGEIRQLDEFYAAVGPTADEGGRLFMFGTAKDTLEAWAMAGDKGEVVREVAFDGPDGLPAALPVKAGANGMTFCFIPYFIHPSRDAAWMEQKERTYTGNLDNLYREFPSSLEDCFAVTGKTYFHRATLRETINFVRNIFESRDRRGTLIMPDGPDSVRFVEDRSGEVVIHATEDEFAALLATKRPFAIGGDSAGERKSGDYFAGSALQRGVIPTEKWTPAPEIIVPHRQLLTIHGYMDTDLFAHLMMRAGYLCGSALLVIEVTGGWGAAVAKECRKLHYPNLYYRHTSPLNRKDKPTLELGWSAKGAGKPIGYGETERAFRNGWLEIRDLETLVEMGDVMSMGGGRIAAPDPKHDDLPDSVVMAMIGLPYTRDFLGRTMDAPPDLPYFSSQRVLERMKATKAKAGVLGNEMGSYMT